MAVHDARGNSGFFCLRGEDEAECVVRVNLNDVETVLRQKSAKALRPQSANQQRAVAIN